MVKFLFTILTSSFLTDLDLAIIYDFSTQEGITAWRIVNDVVMGGVSKSSIVLTPDGHGKFAGNVSLDNNGGFASIQLDKKVALSKGQKFIVLRVKGDGKLYEFRLKGKTWQTESYVHQFATSGAWENIKLPISEFYPQYRGRKLDIPNFSFENIEQISFLIANKKEEYFELLIDWIGVE